MEGIFEEASKFSRINPENPNLSEKEKSAVELYNSALSAFSMKNEDIAIIELKKSVALDPELYEAKTLLGICYYHMGAYEKSGSMFKDVGIAEKNGMLAYRIKSDMENKDKTSDPRNVNTRKIDRKESGTAPVRIKTEKEKKTIVIKYIAGIMIGLIIGLISGLPGYFSSGDKLDIDEFDAEYEQKIVLIETDISDVLKELNELDMSMETVKTEHDKAREESDYLESVIELYKAENLFKAGDKTQARDILNSLKTNEFKSPYLEKYNFLIDELM